MLKELNQDFRIRVAGSEKWYPMTIPGSAMDTFVNEHILPDPFYRKNEYQVREFFRNDFEIEGKFLLKSTELRYKTIKILFHGLDTIADISINGHFVGHTENMHRRFEFSIKEYLQEGENILFVYLKSPIRYIESVRPTKGREIHMVNTGTMAGEQYLRKAHSMFGWDWGPQLPDVGIFRKIELVCFDDIRLKETYIRQRHTDDGVELNLETEVENPEGKSSTVYYEVFDPNQKIIYQGENTKIIISSPQLWWPRGYGDQPLYTVKVRLNHQEYQEYQVGLRTITISQEKDQWGNEFTFVVNGVKIFTRGANYIPDDCFYSRINHDILVRDIQAADFAEFNCLRVWGGGFYPSEDFYDLCDRYGILVWQDLMFACNIYDLNAEFIHNIETETRDNLRRFRNHASLALVCGNNEMETAWVNWSDTKGHALSLQRDYLIQFEYILPKVVKETIPEVFYWPSSPSSGGSFENPGDENRGDCHYWDVWHKQKPFQEYLNHYFRFCSEFGFQSLPSIKTIESFTTPEDRNLFSSVMESHQKNPAANGRLLYYLSENFRYPKDLESLVFLSQILQGYAMKIATEHWRRNRGRCMGSLYWQFNDNWPVLSWSSMDYYGRYKALQYMSREFNAPIAGSIKKQESEISFYISNETRVTQMVQGRILLKDFDFTVLEEKKFLITVEPLSVAEVSKNPFGYIFCENEEKQNHIFVEMEYSYLDTKTKQQIIKYEFETFLPIKYLNLYNPDFHVERNKDGSVVLQASYFAPYVMIEGIDQDIIWNRNVISCLDNQPQILYPLKKEKENGKIPKIKLYDVYHTYY